MAAKGSSAVSDSARKAAARRAAAKRQASGPSWQHGLWALAVLAGGFAAFLAVRTTLTRPVMVATQQQEVEVRKTVPCATPLPKDTEDACRPQRCGRAVWDKVLDLQDLVALRNMASDIMNIGPGAAGGPTILDLHSGALSHMHQFVDVYRTLAAQNQTIDPKDLEIYTRVRQQVQELVAEEFNAGEGLALTKPTFFSRITNKTAVTKHDEYWHEHIDKVTYGTFEYTCLVYLSDAHAEFEGGDFRFTDSNFLGYDRDSIVEPRFGRVSCFTSGPENRHRIDQVTSGTRFALTIAFTCNPKHAISDPNGTGPATKPAVPDVEV